MDAQTPPRIYCIPARDAPVVAVLRRGPSSWAHVGRWDLVKRRYEPGAWLRGRIFPRRSDLSPDGRFLCYFAHKPSSTWEHGDTYVAISKLPWLTALDVLSTCGTWTRGYCFTPDGACDAPAPVRLPIPYGLQAIPVVQFANERRAGWLESADSPPRRPNDAWDVHRNVRMEKRQPHGTRLLRLESVGEAFREFGHEQAVDGLRVRYALETQGDVEPLDDLQWADWDTEGKLLVATRSGRLQIRKLAAGRHRVVFDEDLSSLEPNPRPSPASARRW